MLYIKSFSNYEEFKQIFGVRVFDGEIARKNRILLSLLKDRKLFKASVKSGDLTLFSFKNLVDLSMNWLVRTSSSTTKRKREKQPKS